MGLLEEVVLVLRLDAINGPIGVTGTFEGDFVDVATRDEDEVGVPNVGKTVYADPVPDPTESVGNMPDERLKEEESLKSDDEALKFVGITVDDT